MRRRDLELVTDVLGQELAKARRVGGETGSRADAVLLVVQGFQEALARENPSFPVGKFREAVRKAAENALPQRISQGTSK